MKQLSVKIEGNKVEFFEEGQTVMVLNGLSEESLNAFRDGYRAVAGTIYHQAYLQGAKTAFACVLFEMNKRDGAEAEVATVTEVLATAPATAPVLTPAVAEVPDATPAAVDPPAAVQTEAAVPAADVLPAEPAAVAETAPTPSPSAT